ncbi:MAG: hypothetical protein LC794_13350 [Acidobacteria bacterium]|nr:hypothetical protein [Acidobacteriota bacterium]MCA1627657.1 hypothetical protein [Acidobacteriota bacterium]
MSSGILNYIGLTLGILSILATVYFAVRYAERKEPRFISLNDRKIAVSDDAPEEIQIFYKGEKVEQVTSTLIWFWNEGKRPIKKEDLSRSQPLLIKLQSDETPIEILDVSVRKSSRDAIGFKAIKNSHSSVSVEFEFLDYRDGAVVEIQHTGTRQTSVEVVGVVLGSPKGIRRAARRKFAWLPFPVLPLRYSYSQSAKARPSKFSRLVMTIIFVGFFGGFGFFLLYYGSNDITTSPELVHAALRNYLTDDSLISATKAIEENAKYQTINTIAPYAMAGIILLNLFLGLAILWRSPFAFPNSLIIEDSSKAPAEKNEAHQMKKIKDTSFT